MDESRTVPGRPGRIAYPLLGAGWVLLLSGVAASFALPASDTLPAFGMAFVGLAGMVCVVVGCSAILKARSKQLAGLGVFGIPLAFLAVIGIFVNADAQARETQKCHIATASQVGGDFSRAYRYQVACPSATYTIGDTSKPKRGAKQVYEPGRRVTVNHVPGDADSAKFGDPKSVAPVLLGVNAAGTFLLTAGAFVSRLRFSRPSRMPSARWGWVLMGAGWLLLPTGVALLGLLAAPLLVSLPVMAVGSLLLSFGCALAAARRRPQYLAIALFAGIAVTVGSYESAEKLRMAEHGREYVCQIALERTVPGTQITRSGNFVLCPNDSHATMSKTFGFKDVGRRVEVTWDPERRQKATLSSDLEPGDLAMPLGRLPLILLAPLALIALSRRFPGRDRPELLSAPA
ncbi:MULTISPECIES: hypothetical protein [Actinomadura]|uniref:DUF3592 domain-containing protein n=1 Tax=Actinomadura yumaensis TaxID=111807 RepID=A0ABW2CF80_9ACTN|nr:hypothetical protein [Actinomadura sp. J1-007]MWK34526.1 hypothetical protein [Actinomadura sp. J1-007]